MYSKPLVIGIGEFLWDVLPIGRKAGGAPVNFAYHASQNGVEGWAVSAVGNDDAGRDLLAITDSYGIRTGLYSAHGRDAVSGAPSRCHLFRHAGTAL